MLHPDGEIPLFHGGLVTVERPTREVLALAAAVLHEPLLATAGEMPGIWPMLVLGESGRRVYAHLPRQRTTVAEPRALRRSGFYVLPGEPGDVMVLDGNSPPPGWMTLTLSRYQRQRELILCPTHGSELERQLKTELNG